MMLLMFSCVDLPDRWVLGCSCPWTECSVLVGWSLRCSMSGVRSVWSPEPAQSAATNQMLSCYTVMKMVPTPVSSPAIQLIVTDLWSLIDYIYF